MSEPTKQTDRLEAANARIAELIETTSKMGTEYCDVCLERDIAKAKVQKLKEAIQQVRRLVMPDAGYILDDALASIKEIGDVADQYCYRCDSIPVTDGVTTWCKCEPEAQTEDEDEF